jgi:hypothetical protein
VRVAQPIPSGSTSARLWARGTKVGVLPARLRVRLETAEAADIAVTANAFFWQPRGGGLIFILFMAPSGLCTKGLWDVRAKARSAGVSAAKRVEQWRTLPSRLRESHFWRHNSYSLQRQGLIAVFEATSRFCRDKTPPGLDEPPSASRAGALGRREFRSKTPPTNRLLARPRDSVRAFSCRCLRIEKCAAIFNKNLADSLLRLFRPLALRAATEAVTHSRLQSGRPAPAELAATDNPVPPRPEPSNALPGRNLRDLQQKALEAIASVLQVTLDELETY